MFVILKWFARKFLRLTSHRTRIHTIQTKYAWQLFSQDRCRIISKFNAFFLTFSLFLLWFLYRSDHVRNSYCCRAFTLLFFKITIEINLPICSKHLPHLIWWFKTPFTGLLQLLLLLEVEKSLNFDYGLLFAIYGFWRAVWKWELGTLVFFLIYQFLNLWLLIQMRLNPEEVNFLVWLTVHNSRTIFINRSARIIKRRPTTRNFWVFNCRKEVQSLHERVFHILVSRLKLSVCGFRWSYIAARCQSGRWKLLFIIFTKRANRHHRNLLATPSFDLFFHK